MIAVNHFGGPLPTLTYQPFGYVTGAEGFVLISGIAVGLLARRFTAANRLDFNRWCLRRAGWIYAVHLAILAVILSLAMAPGAPAEFVFQNMPELAVDPLQKVPAAIGLLYQPRYNAILPLYCLLLLMTPPAIAALRRFGPPSVLGASVLIWAGVQIGWPTATVDAWATHHGLRLGIKNPLAWQLLFVIGLVGGFRPGWYGERLKSLPLRTPLLFVVIAIGLKICLSLHAGIPDVFLDGDRLGAIRLVNTLILAYLVWHGCSRHPDSAANPVSFLGRYSLPVFAWQIVGLYLWRPWFDETTTPPGLMVLGGLTLAASQFIPAHLTARWRARNASVSPTP